MTEAVHVSLSTDAGKVSVIMPVHNAAAYIAESMNSVRQQTYADWELIIVNDGSTDGSDDVVRAMLSKDARIHLINQVKMGPSAARNRGLQEASGQFLYCLDADDLLEPDAFELCVAVLSHQKLDIITFDSQSFVDAGKAPEKAPPSYDRSRALEDGAVYGMDDFVARCYQAGVLRANACLYMFSRALLDGLRFPEGSHYAEESLFCYLACLRTARIAYSARRLHRRRWRSDSLVGSATGRVMIDGYLVNLGVLQGYSPPNGRFMAHTLFVAATVNYLMQAFLRVENDQDTYLERVDAAQASWLRLCSRINSGNERLRKHLRA